MVREVGFPGRTRATARRAEENGHSYTYTYGSLYGKLDATQEIPVKVIWSIMKCIWVLAERGMFRMEWCNWSIQFLHTYGKDI